MQLELNNVIDKYDKILYNLNNAFDQKDIGNYIPAFADNLQDLFPDSLIASLILKGDSRIVNFHTTNKIPKNIKDSMSKEMENHFKQLSMRFKNDFWGPNSKMEDDERLISDTLISIPFYNMGFPAGLFSVMLPQQIDELPDSDLLLEYCLTEHLEKTFGIINKIQEKASRDVLTNLYGRNFFSFAVQYFFESKNENEACLLMDIDNFKNINDSYGHEIGDAVLVQIATVICDNIPPEAIPIRLGGDEFVVLVPGADSLKGAEIAEFLLKAVRKTDLSTDLFSIRATLSIGVAGTDMLAVKEPDNLLSQADKAVYLAKKNGRNQVRMATEKVELPINSNSSREEKQEDGFADSAAVKVLLVDDDLMLLEMTQAILERGGGFQVNAFQKPEEALEFVAEASISLDVMVTDLEMPEMNGLELIHNIRNIDENIVPIIITGYSSTENAISSLQESVYAFMSKPFDNAELITTVRKAAEKSAMQRKLDSYHNHLEEILQQKTKELTGALSKTAALYEQTLATIIQMLDVHEQDSAIHSKRVAEFALIIAKQAGIDDKSMLNDIKVGALLHDIGKIGVPVSILQKPKQLSDEELQVMREHPAIGFQILSKLPDMTIAAEMAYSHHERFDGTGYPRELSGKNIPLGARIFALADTFDAMRFDRSYRKKCTADKIVAEVNRYSGTQFEPELVEVFNNCFDELEAKAFEL